MLEAGKPASIAIKPRAVSTRGILLMAVSSGKKMPLG
jgi:hypothetical protein